MALPSKSFSGKTFFSDIRTEMANNRGLFAGRDGKLVYACMDATFYRLKVLNKGQVNGDDVLYTQAAVAASGRVVANGQWFNTAAANTFTRYCFTGPCSDKPWDGEIIVDGVVQKPAPRVYDKGWYHFGQLAGRSQLAYSVREGAPSKGVDGKLLRNAISALLPAVSKGKKATEVLAAYDKNILSSGGKPFYGLHRSSDIVFVLIQEDAAGLQGKTVSAIADLLISMGVDDAVIGDGSNSVTLVVDDVIEVAPHEIKDNTMRCGPMFVEEVLKTQPSAATLVAAASSLDPSFPPGTIITGVNAQFLQTNVGLKAEISSFGAGGNRNKQQIITDLQVTVPMTLNAATSRFTATSAAPSVMFAGPNVNAAIVFSPKIDSAGSVAGTLNVNTSRGLAVFVVNWTLQP